MPWRSRASRLPAKGRRCACDVMKMIDRKVVCIQGRDKYRDEDKKEM